MPDEADHATLVSHGLFEPFAHADWDTERLLSESTVEFDAVLLGDNHKPDTAEVQDTWVTYCGSTERASASEREDRGYNLVTFETDNDEGDAVAISRRALTDTRDFEFVDVDLEDGEGIDRVQERVREYEVEESVVIITIEGDGRPVTPAAVEELAIDRGALVARVNDRRDLPDEDDDVSVSFADPDDAVRERVRELGLSNAALEIDKTVRDGDLVDSNVRESVERRVRDLLEDDQSAFDPAPARSPDDEDVTTVADQLSSATEPAEETADEQTAAKQTSEETQTAETDQPTGEPETATADDSSDGSESAESTESADSVESTTEREQTTPQSTDEDASLGDFA